VTPSSTPALLQSEGVFKLSSSARKRHLLWITKALGLTRLARRASRNQLRILCYHGIWLGDQTFAGDAMFMRAQDFAERLVQLKKWNYTFIALDDAVRFLQDDRLPQSAVVITIDDGWFGTYSNMLPALEEAEIPATIYCDTANLERHQPVPQVMATYLRKVHCRNRCLSRQADLHFSAALDFSKDFTDRLANAFAFANECGVDIAPYISARAFEYMSIDELKDAKKRGFDIQLHTHTHSLHDFSSECIHQEIEQNRAALVRHLELSAEHFAHFCYPSGHTSDSAMPVLRELGIKSATTLENTLCSPSSNPLLLPRLIDGSQLSLLEFEAEMASIGDVYRLALASLNRFQRIDVKNVTSPSAASTFHSVAGADCTLTSRTSPGLSEVSSKAVVVDTPEPV
jgi:peptidoglycan/xylan/chitin deacetylase (PgdA/CDA1 family)